MKKEKSKPESRPLRVLILEDNPVDAELVVRQLLRAKLVINSRLVEDKKNFEKALQEFRPEIILSDYSLPKFDGTAALEMTRTHLPDVPFIFVSGSIGESKAIETLSQGAADYIFKDNLQRLAPAVRRALKEARLQQEKKHADEQLHRHIEELRILAEAADRFVHINELDKVYEYLAQTIRTLSGANYLLLSLYDDALQAVRPKLLAGAESFLETIRRRFRVDLKQMVFYLKDMRADDFKDFVSRRLLPVRDGLYGLANRTLPRQVCRAIEKLLGIDAMFTMGFSWENQLFGGLTIFFTKDSSLKNAPQVEALVNQAAVAIKRLLAETSLRQSEERFRRISETMSDISFSCQRGPDKKYTLSWLTGAVDRITGYSNTELMSMKCWGRLVLAEDQSNFEKYVTGLTPGNSGICELRLRHKNGDAVWVQSFTECSRNLEYPNQLVLFGGLMDISERKRIEIRLRESKEYYRTLVETSPDAIIIVDGGARVTFASKKTMDLFAIPAKADVTGMSIMDFIMPDEKERVQKRLVEILSGRSLPEIGEYRLQRLDGRSFWADVHSAPLRDAAGRSVGLLLICRDISTRKSVETEILREKTFLKKLIEAAPEGIAITDCPGRVLQVNNEFENMFGYRADEIVGKLIDGLIAPPGFQEEAGGLTEASGSGSKVVIETVRQRKDGSLLNVSIVGAPIHIAGQQVAVYAIYRDISERKRAEMALRRSENLLSKIIDILPVGLWIADKKGTLIRSNSAGRQIWGAEPLVGREEYGIFKARRLPSGEAIAPDDWALAHTIKEKTTITDEMLEIDAFDGTKKTILNYTAPVVDETGNVEAAVIINLDISARQQAEELIRASLKEKEVLLQEIHHRVKNNLQIISGLLTLQADQAAGKSVQDIFRESQDRIRSIALIHEKLYQSRNLAEIPFDEYLRALVDNLFISHSIASGRIRASYVMERIYFTIEKAIPLGLIVNELVTNSLKHAFPAERRGTIRIELHGQKDAKFVGVKSGSGKLFQPPTCELIVADDGIGLPASRIPGQEKTLGMNLIAMLAKQLQAEIKISTGPGSEFRFFFSGLPTSKSGKDHDGKK